MKDEMKKVRDFHEKFRFQIDQNIEDMTAPCDETLRYQAQLIRAAADTMLELGLKWDALYADRRAICASLLLEELAETIVAMANKNNVRLADGVGDLLYVVIGIAVKFKLPLKEIFEEIHASNMSKTWNENDPRIRVKDTTKGYFPPNLAKVLNDNAQ